jgi:hypothetical protein
MTFEEWWAAIPDPAKAGDGEKAAAAAIDDARAAVRAVAFAYHGTLPPPPWPAHPELVSAIDDMEKVRDFAAVVARRTPDAFWPKDGPVGKTIEAKGRELFAQVAILKRDGTKATTLPEVARAVFPKFKLPGGGLLLLVALLVLANDDGGRD